jgi:hypothetical protein
MMEGIECEVVWIFLNASIYEELISDYVEINGCLSRLHSVLF